MILFFDTETTGLIKDFKHPTDGSENFPHIVQLAYAVYSWEGELIHSSSSLIYPEGWEIEPQAQSIHNRSLAECYAEGKQIAKVLKPFLEWHKKVDLVIAHSYNFDSRVVRSELIRLGSDYDFKSVPHFCTMLKTRKFCGLNKWPKLIELHQILFNEDFDGAHDALSDVLATARCFFELKKRKVFDKETIIL